MTSLKIESGSSTLITDVVLNQRFQFGEFIYVWNGQRLVFESKEALPVHFTMFMDLFPDEDIACSGGGEYMCTVTCKDQAKLIVNGKAPSRIDSEKGFAVFDDEE